MHHVLLRPREAEAEWLSATMAVGAVFRPQSRARAARALAPARDVAAAPSQLLTHEARVARAAIPVSEQLGTLERQLDVDAPCVQQPQ